MKMKDAYITPWADDYALKLKEVSGSYDKIPDGNKYKPQIVWRNVIAFFFMHLAALYGIYLICTEAKIQTWIFVIIYGNLGGVGVTAGAHRLWAHRAYRAKWPFRLFLALLQTIAFQNHIYEWVRDHRFYFVLMPLLTIIVPTWIPVRFWNESLSVSWYVAGMMRYVMSLHLTWLVNSAAHIYGNKPYDRHIGPTQNIWVSVLAEGEGWHNYHHTFPWDYKAAELGNYRANFTTALIDLAAMCGLAYDLKTVSDDMIPRRVMKYGDGSHPLHSQVHAEENITR